MTYKDLLEFETDDDNNDFHFNVAQEVNHTCFEKYIGKHIFFVCIILQILNPKKRIILHEHKIKYHNRTHFFQNPKTINVFYNEKKRVTKIRLETDEKIE